MSYTDDNFESYSVGATLPFGTWTATFGNPTLVSIVSGGTEQAASGSTKAVQLVGGRMCRELDSSTHEAYDSSVTIYGAFFPTQAKLIQGEPLDLVFVENGPDRTFGTYTNLCGLRIENDSTISAYHGDLSFSPLFVGNSGDHLVKLQSWNFLQFSVNLGIFTDPLSHIDFLQISVKVWLNGELVIDKSSVITPLQISLMRGPLPLPNTVAKWTQVEFHSSLMLWDNITIDSGSTSAAGYIHIGSPVDKVYQGAAEIPIEPDSAKISVFQGVTEISELPNSTKLTIFQGVVELILLQTIVQGLWKVKEY